MKKVIEICTKHFGSSPFMNIKEGKIKFNNMEISLAMLVKIYKVGNLELFCRNIVNSKHIMNKLNWS